MSFISPLQNWIGTKTLCISLKEKMNRYKYEKELHLRLFPHLIQNMVHSTKTCIGQKKGL